MTGSPPSRDRGVVGNVAPEIRTRPKPDCPVCGETGRPLYSGLPDRLWAAPGNWSLSRCSDQACGLLWLDPAPVEGDMEAAYARYYTHDEDSPTAKGWGRRFLRGVLLEYLRRRFGYSSSATNLGHRILASLLPLHPLRQAEADFNVLYLPAVPDGTLLDVGCGNGSFLQRMERLGWVVEGVDPDEWAVAAAKKRGLSVRLGNLESQGFPQGRFHAVTLCHVIEHVFDPLELLRECLRILKPGGRVVVVTPNGQSWGHERFGRSWRGLEPPRHIQIFTPVSLEKIAREAGFPSVRVFTTVRDADSIFLQSRSLKVGVSPPQEAHAGLLLRMWSRGMQWVEWARMKEHGDTGEEIALVASKEER